MRILSYRSVIVKLQFDQPSTKIRIFRQFAAGGAGRERRPGPGLVGRSVQQRAFGRAESAPTILCLSGCGRPVSSPNHPAAGDVLLSTPPQQRRVSLPPGVLDSTAFRSRPPAKSIFSARSAESSNFTPSPIPPRPITESGSAVRPRFHDCAQANRMMRNDLCHANGRISS